jgi:hypothetical protein
MAFVSHAPTILVFDSGLGGLTVFREIVKLRPDARYTYVADDAYFPYGQHTEDEIIAGGAADRRSDRRTPAGPCGHRLQHRIDTGHDASA